jgi:hypothetical protein
MGRACRFSLRTLVFGLTIAAIAIGMVSREANRQRRAVDQLEAGGARVEFAHQFTFDSRHAPVPRGEVPNAPMPGPDWLRELLGDHYFVTPIKVWHVDDAALLEGLPTTEEIYGLKLDDEDLPHIKALSELKVLMLNQMSSAEYYDFLSSFPNLVHFAVNRVGFDDADAVHLVRVPNLQWLQMSDTRITDEALRHVSSLRNLQVLNLSGTKVSDVGIAYISDCKSLKDLMLSRTAVTDLGLEQLARLQYLDQLNLDRTQVTDKGIMSLAGARSLRWLSVRGTAVTSVGAANLQRRIPGLVVDIKPFPKQ